jgi:hypothetical protein
MNESLGIQRSASSIDRIAIQIEFNQIAGGYQFRRQRPGHNESVRRLVVPYAHVPETIQHFVLGKHSIRCNEVFDETGIQSAGRRGQWRLLAGSGSLTVRSRQIAEKP